MAAIEAAKPKDKTYVLTDGGGLHIDVLPSGTKVWRYKYHFGGRRDKITIGRYPAISLKQARQIHEALQTAVEQGDDPKELELADFVGTRESNRVLRRLHFLRECSHEQEQQVFP